jgi:dephospho-CoA kinase
VKDKLVQKLDDLEQSISRKMAQQKKSTSTQEGESASVPPPTQAIAVVEAAMLLESGWDDMLDAVWVVRTPQGMALDRMVTHRNMDPADALQRIEAQSARKGICPISLSQALDQNIVTAIIENDSNSLEHLTQQLQQAWNDPKCWKEGCCPL